MTLPVYWLAQLVVHEFVSPPDMPRVFACMDVFVAPFIRPATETFGLVNIEAAAAGVPFIHFGTGGIQVPPNTACVFSPVRFPSTSSLCRTTLRIM